MIQRNSKLCDFPVHSVCFLQNFFFRSEEKFLSVLYHCAKFYKFSPSTFRVIFDRNINFAKFSRVTRSLNLHLREPGVLARTRAISGPGRARQETISSHLKYLLGKVGKRIGMLGRARRNISMHSANKVYKSYIIPVIDYCDAVWNCCGTVNSDKLERLQR